LPEQIDIPAGGHANHGKMFGEAGSDLKNISADGAGGTKYDDFLMLHEIQCI
jgi:hypothetical protein